MEEKMKVSLTISNLNMISAFAPTTELKERLKNAHQMLKQKAQEHFGVDYDGSEFEEMIKMRTWVSRDPEMAERIRQANHITSQVLGMTVTMEFTKEEIEALITSIDGKYFPNEELTILKSALPSI